MLTIPNKETARKVMSKKEPKISAINVASQKFYKIKKNRSIFQLTRTWNGEHEIYHTRTSQIK